MIICPYIKRYDYDCDKQVMRKKVIIDDNIDKIKRKKLLEMMYRKYIDLKENI